MAEPRSRNERWIFQAPDLVVGEFRCLPGDPAWQRTNRISHAGPLLAFPRTTVGIAQEGRGDLVADPSLAVIYAAGQPYRRRLLAADGDRCSYIGISPELAADIASSLDPAAGAPHSPSYPFVAAPVNPRDYLLHQGIRRRLLVGEGKPDEVRESLYWLVARVLAAGYHTEGSPTRRPRPATRRAHAEAVDATRALLCVDLGERISLDGLARAVHVSPFHLSRIFRARTGKSIHAYRTEIRLRASLERLADGDSLATVAADLGFASHAHLTESFKRSFGVTPQLWRASLGNGIRLEMGRNLKATA